MVNRPTNGQEYTQRPCGHKIISSCSSSRGDTRLWSYASFQAFLVMPSPSGNRGRRWVSSACRDTCLGCTVPTHEPLRSFKTYFGGIFKRAVTWTAGIHRKASAAERSCRVCRYYGPYPNHHYSSGHTCPATNAVRDGNWAPRMRKVGLGSQALPSPTLVLCCGRLEPAWMIVLPSP